VHVWIDVRIVRITASHCDFEASTKSQWYRDFFKLIVVPDILIDVMEIFGFSFSFCNNLNDCY
jgi:hypothetical protein